MVTRPLDKGSNAMATAEAVATKPLDMTRDPGPFLVQAGWIPLGIPELSTTMWLDGTRPIDGYWSETAMKTTDNDGREIDLVAQYGRGASNKQRVVRKQYTPPAEPVSQGEALREQMRRDHAKAIEAHRAKK